MNTFKAYKYEKETIGVRYHEGGHAAIARIANRAIRVRAWIRDVESGKTKLRFPPGTDDLVKYQVAVAGCLAEAKIMSGQEIDVAPGRIAIAAAQIDVCLRQQQAAFPVEVPVTGDAIMQAACNKGDFEWLNGRRPNGQRLRNALIFVGNHLRDPGVWTSVEVVARMLLQYGVYDSQFDVE